MSMKVL